MAKKKKGRPEVCPEGVPYSLRLSGQDIANLRFVLSYLMSECSPWEHISRVKAMRFALAFTAEQLAKLQESKHGIDTNEPDGAPCGGQETAGSDPRPGTGRDQP